MDADVLRELREAWEHRAAVEREAERARTEATNELVAAIRRAQDAGVTMAQIARELHVSRQRLYQLLERGG